MKKFSPAFVFLIISFLPALFSCKKINEATTLGGDLIPAVDNVTTFETFLDAETASHLFPDSTKVEYNDQVAAGDLNDPDFGHTHANFEFNVTPATIGSYPFLVTDSLRIDSVVLSLSYAGAYGDTAGGSQTLRVYEIDPNSSFRADTNYRYTDPASEFPTTGSELGSVTFMPGKLKDSIPVVRPGDTTKVANVVRIKFNDISLGQRFSQYDTTSTINGGFHSDSIFRTLFKGLAVRADNSGNLLTYFKLSDATNTKLMVYFRAINNGDTTYSSVDFTHTVNGQSNYVQRQHSANVGTGGSDKLYVQSAPGSYTTVKIAALDTFSNKVVYRAELIATRVAAASDNIFTSPPRLYLDRINAGADSSYIFEKDLILGSDGSVGFDLFGGTLRSDNTYHFNITRYVQGILTSHQRNDLLRLWAPLRSWDFSKSQGTYVRLPVNTRIAEGRTVVGGGSYADPKARLRLRIVYSNL